MIFPTTLMSAEGLKRLRLDEDFEAEAYDDATGFRVRAPKGNLTIGYGTNLAIGITDEEAELLMLMRLITSENKLEATFAPFPVWAPVQRDVLMMIDYNTGNVLKWPKLITSIATDAPGIQQANNIRDSEAWRSTLTRARYERFAQALINGHW